MQSYGTRRVLPALALVGAVFVAGSAGGAVAAGLITGADIKNGSITGKDIKNKSVKSGDLSAATVASLQGATGPAGPAGAAGSAGVAGPAGPSGVNDLEFIFDSALVTGGEPTDLFLECPAGKNLIDITGWWFSSSAAVQTLPFEDLTGGLVYTEGVPDDDELYIGITCAVVDLADPAPPRPSAPLKN